MTEKTPDLRTMLAQMKERAEIAGRRNEHNQSTATMWEKFDSQADVSALIAALEAALAVEPASTDQDLIAYVVFQNEGYNQGLRDTYLAMTRAVRDHNQGETDAREDT